MLRPGDRLGAYQLVSLLGTGGMGEVYRARDTKLQRDVALKVLRPEFGSDSDRLRRLTNEARAASALNHPNILTVYDVDVSDDGPFIAVELVDGQTLRQRLHSGAVPVAEAVDIAMQVAQALTAAHARGIVHRDLKPENVMLRPDGYVKVLDFGLAVLRPDAVGAGALVSAFETIEPHHGGTPAYMAPEQIHGRAVDGRADIFALGVLLCELVTGSNPFARPTILETLAAIGETPQPVDSANLPRDVRTIVLRALAARPDDRYRTMTELVVALRDVKGSLDHPADTRLPRALTRAAAGLGAAVLTLAAAWWLRPQQSIVSPPMQITHFSTAVRDPAVSPDGRWIVYVVQDAETPFSQLYVQAGPTGQPRQLTHTLDQKRYPAFTRDGSRIAYTVTGPEWQWDTWVVPLVGGEPRVLLPNASALQWVDDRRVLFAEFKKGMQLGVVLADESRAGAQDLYVPDADAMAHHAEMSPDGRRVAIGEMRAALYNSISVPVDCFVMSVDKSSDARSRVGTADIPCSMFLRWSHDGRWIYFSSGRGNQYQVFRQPAAGGRPEQITAGTGLAVLGVTSSFVLTPDDRTLIYPSGEGQEAIWMRSLNGSATQLTVEGNARDPVPSRDGHSIFYIAAPRYVEGPLWMRAADGTSSQQICPGFNGASVAPSPDGRQVVFTRADAHGHVHVWVGSVVNASAPREIAGGDDDWLTPAFAHDGKTVFAVERRRNGDTRIAAVPIEGQHVRGLTQWEPALELRSISPDNQWVSVVRAGVTPRETWLYPAGRDGNARKLWNTWALEWTANGRGFLLTSGGMVSRAWMLPNVDEALVPRDLGQEPSEATLERLGARRVMTEYFFVEPTALPDANGIVYGKVENHSNLYRLTLPH